ncbi:hypothetical protein BKA67DRAFT_584639 [Truncatella angustata]|uniref:Uncharacterized protein n=1 Tax=Truncatella angustata TaxID=152316 RepID=A0A9P8RG63_9PEZI|nr:uncharacterized protein BKA67DRAFT_584639 [Truncatella angustata]KAH6645252.1 hypothetical protein BKA67DRAFT_584639 [Truncatella angustata]KAH8200595.1 hypothetical protein TruAng_005247 [Truncatella angustata]
MTADLRTLLTPELFRFLVDEWIPFSRTDPIEFAEAIAASLFRRRADTATIKQKTWPALKALSLLGLDHVPDLFAFLPPPEDPDFPTQALGLLLVFDQAPRTLLKGVDVRWTYAYFGEISIKFLQQLQTLPSQLHPAGWNRWKDSVSLEFFVFVRLWFNAPLWHHEKMATQGVSFTDETRQLVERATNTRDPYRDQPDKRWHLHGFPNMLKEGGPKSPCGVVPGAFWISCLLDVHKPPLDLYGRYPWQNGAFGRVNTPDEADWLDTAEIFSMDPEVRERIRQDVEAGKWTPLGDSD